MVSKPWQYNTDLAEQRLVALASLIVKVRADVIDLHDEGLGDTRLSLGMRAYECCRTIINRVAGSEEYPWLHKVTPENRFTFAIGNTPVRFTRNDVDDLPDHKLVVSQEAQYQLSLLEASVENYGDIRWFFVLETQFDSPADAVFFVGYTELGEVMCQWKVPIEHTVPSLSVVNPRKLNPVDLPKPHVGVKKKTPERKAEEEGNDNGSSEES